MGEGEETPYELVRRLRSEGVPEPAVKDALLTRGLDTADVALLLEQPPEVKPVERAIAEGAETPWAILQRRRAEGYPRDAIEAELKERGLDQSDIRALFADDPRVPTGEQADAGGTATSSGAPVQAIFGGLMVLTGGLILAAGWIGLLPIILIVSGLLRLITALTADHSVTQQRRAAQREMRELPAEDQRSRCARHPTLASIGTCPRCGSFCCARCTPAIGFKRAPHCLTCQALPDVVRERQRSASRMAALFLLAAPAMVGLIMALDIIAGPDPTPTLGVVVLFAVVAAPWLVLAAIQAAVTHFWPSVLSFGPWVLVAIGMMLISQGGAFLQLVMWLVPLGFAVAGWHGITQARTSLAPLVADDVKTASA